MSLSAVVLVGHPIESSAVFVDVSLYTEKISRLVTPLFPTSVSPLKWSRPVISPFGPALVA
jgi:hypothetical protein